MVEFGRANVPNLTHFVNPTHHLYTFCMRKKLLVISPSLGRSGMERNLAYFFEHYDPGQFEIGFAYFDRLYPKTQTSPLEDSLQRISRSWHLPLSGKHGIIDAGIQIVKLMEAWEPEVVLGKEWFASCAAVFGRNRLPDHAQIHPKIVALIENDPYRAFVHQVEQERLSRTKKIVYKYLLKQCDAVVGVSRGVTAESARVFGLPHKKLSTIYNGVDLSLVKKLAQIPPTHRWLKPSRFHVNGIPVMVSSARLSPEKDLGTLIRAIALLNKTKRVRAIILGSGLELPALRQLAKQVGVVANIDFHGYTSNPFSFMAHADAFVMTSISEGFPSVLLEAMACEVPVVYTDCRFGPNEIIEQEKNGLLVPMRNPEACAKAITSILDDQKFAQRMVRNASHTVKNFNVKKTVRDLSRLLRQI